MAFKHIKHLFNASGVSETLYTVPSGKEFVLLRKRARYLSSSGSTGNNSSNADSYELSGGASGQVSFASNNNTLETINISNSDNIVNGAITKSVFSSGATITGTSTISSAMAELMGLEFNAGTWEGISSASNSSSGGGSSASGSLSVYFSGDYSEFQTLHYEGTFIPTQTTVTFKEWVNNATSMRTVNILCGNIHVTGSGYNWAEDAEITVDEYRTIWLCPVGAMDNYYFWVETPDDASRQSIIENDEIHPAYSWGIYEYNTAPTDAVNVSSAIGYFPPQTNDTLPTLQSANSAWTESAGSWDNITFTVIES